MTSRRDMLAAPAVGSVATTTLTVQVRVLHRTQARLPSIIPVGDRARND